MNNQFKSILFKRKYYAISFKLNYIMKSNLFKHRREKNIVNTDIDIDKKDNVVCVIPKQITLYDRFIFAKLKIRTKYVLLYKYFGKLHRDNKPAYIIFSPNGEIKYKQYYYNGEFKLS